jgi:small subunit ribosomal protein S15
MGVQIYKNKFCHLKGKGYLRAVKLIICFISNYKFMLYLDSTKKKEIFEKYGKSNTDTGSPESQIALFSYRISHLTEHLKLNRKDYSTERALTILVGKRRRLLNYVKEKDINRYREIVKNLGLRK